MNRGRLIAHVAATLGLDNTAGTEEVLLLQEWAQQAVDDVLLRTHCRVELGDLTFTPGVSDYRVDSTVLALDEETISANTYPVALVTLGEIYERRRSPSAASTDSVTAIAVEGDLMLVYPTPASVGTLRYVYVAKPARFVDDTSDPSSATYGAIPEEHHLCLEHYMLWRGSIYDGTRAPMAPNDYLQLYLQLCSDARKRTRHKAKRGLSATRVGYPANRGYGRRNDVYPER